MRQNITISLGPEQDAPSRKKALDKLAALHVTGGSGISGLLQRIADGEILLVPRYDPQQAIRQLQELDEGLAVIREVIQEALREVRVQAGRHP